MSRVLVVLIAAMAPAGCQTAVLQQSPVPSAWLSRHGGIEDGVVHARTERATSILAAAAHAPLDVRVLASDAIDAYAWPSGEIYLTRRLVDLLDDRELAAAIAHEVGHLTLHAHPASLKAGRHEEHEEMVADEFGLTVLVGAGLDPGAMARMLTTVSHAVGGRTTAGRALALRASRLANGCLAPCAGPTGLDQRLAVTARGSAVVLAPDVLEGGRALVRGDG